MHGRPEARELLLRQLVQQKLIYLAALDDGLDREPDIQQMLQENREKTLISEYIKRNLATEDPITDTQIQQYYNERQDEYLGDEQVRLQHIQVGSKRTADDLLRRLRAGADFGDLARKHSQDKFSREKGGDLGYILRNRAIQGIGGAVATEDLVEVAFDAATGEIAGPIKVQDKYHIIRIMEAAHRPTAAIDHVKTNISRTLSRERRIEKEKAMMDGLMEKYTVETYTEVLLGEPTKTARELFEDAQTTTDPRERIAAYERIVEDYPNSRDAERALFMIGYVYSNDLQEYSLAEEAFRKLLEKHPEGEYIDDARWMLKNMRLSEKSLERVIKNGPR
jgi:peptidyl-prolyl cis-trans isomerase C